MQHHPPQAEATARGIQRAPWRTPWRSGVWLAAMALGALLAVQGCQAVWAQGTTVVEAGQAQWAAQQQAEAAGLAAVDAAPGAAAVAASAADAAAEEISDGEAIAFLVILAMFPLSVLAIRWFTQQQIQRLMNVDSQEQQQPQGFRHHATTAEVRAKVPVQFRMHDAEHGDAQAAQAREAFVSRSLGLFRRAVLIDVVAGVVYVVLLTALGLTTGDTTSRVDMTIGFAIIGLLYPALAGLRYWVYRRQFRATDSRRSWLARIPLVAWLRVLLAWRVIRQLQREPGVRLLVLRVFGIDANASFTFGRVLAFWQHFGNHFTVLDPSIWRHRFPLMSWRTTGFIVLVALMGLVALIAVLSNPAWEPYAFTLTGAALVPLLAAYAFFTQLLLRREFIRSRPQLLQVLDKLEQRPRNLDLSFRHLEAMCHNNTWQLAVDEFAKRSQALLMDLRGFSNERKGCQSEVDFLLDTVPLRQVLFLVDAGGDHELVQLMIRQRWAMLSPDSPNLHDPAPLVHVYVSKASDEADVQGILDLLILAAQSGAADAKRNVPQPAQLAPLPKAA